MTSSAAPRDPARSLRPSRPADALPAAVLWDMDGTLIDTEEYWITAERELIGGYGATWTEADGLALVGKDLLDSAAIIKARTGLPLSGPEIVDRLLDTVISCVSRDLPWRPGAERLHRELYDAGVPMALVTMSYRRFADPVAAALPHSSFDEIVTGDVVSKGKPDPEAYLTAADRLGVPIDRCVALEDSAAGVASALAAGARTVLIHNLVDIPPAPGLSRVASLRDLALPDLARIAAGAVIDTLD